LTLTLFDAPRRLFTKVVKAPKDPLKALSDEERVALDLLLSNGNGAHKPELAALIPNTARRGYVKMLAAQLKSLR